MQNCRRIDQKLSIGIPESLKNWQKVQILLHPTVSEMYAEYIQNAFSIHPKMYPKCIPTVYQMSKTKRKLKP